MPDFNRINLVLAILLICVSTQPCIAGRPAHPHSHHIWPGPGLPDDPSGWIKTIKELYDKTVDSVGFCFGTNPYSLQRLLSDSFQWPLPVASPDLGDPICSNLTHIGKHLCDPEEVSIYYRFMLLTENPEKVPNTVACPSGSDKSPSCAPGFFDANPANRPIPSAKPAQPYACCPGYFCPSNLACMMPCPLGAHCPRAQPAKPPKMFLPGWGNHSRWCAPYAYKERKHLGCGGADRWTVVPTKAFPTAHWDAGSGSLYCNAGWYCPNTTSKLPCPKRHFCRQGSQEPERCPPGAFCGPKTSIPAENYTGLTIDALLLAFLAFVWQVSQWYSSLVQRIGPRERLLVVWRGDRPEVKVVTEGEGNTTPIAPPLEPSIDNNNNRSGASMPPAAGGAVPGTLTPHNGQDQHINGTTSQGSRQALEIEFTNLKLKLKSCGKYVLNGAYGKLRSCRTTAIMGPSGAGKTSLLNALAGRAPYGVVSGRVMINGLPVHNNNLERYKRVMGFVPQDDILHPTLTVEEQLLFSARYRLPATCTHEQRQHHVDHALAALGLNSVRHQLVGDEATRGVSGGQRKRVNIGLELVADPLLLLLDEPTSGLDSSASKALVATLGRVARDGVTVTAVCHQPSYQAFFLFDDVLLLGRGGRTVYWGPVEDVQAYFEGLGYSLPEHMNPADAYLDIITGDLPGPLNAEELLDAWHRRQPPSHINGTFQDMQDGIEEDGVNPGSSTTIRLSNRENTTHYLGSLHGIVLDIKRAAVLATSAASSSISSTLHSARSMLSSVPHRLWYPLPNNYLEVQLLSDDFEEEDSIRDDDGGSQLEASLVVADGVHAGGGGGGVLGGRLLDGSRRKTPGFAPQWWWCLHRAGTRRMREPLAVFTDYSIIALAGMTVGLLSDRGRSTIMSFSSQVSYSIVALGLMGMVGAIPTFGGRDVLVFKREAASGLNRLAYFLALDVFDHGGILVRAALYLVMWASFASPRAVMWQMFVITWVTLYCVAGFGYLLALTMQPASAQLAAAVLALTSTLLARQGSATGLQWVLQQASFARWALEGMVIAESNRLSGVWLLARCADLEALGYDVRRFATCVMALAGLGLFARCLALGAIKWGKRS